MEEIKPFVQDTWVALTQAYTSPYVIPFPVGKVGVIPFGAVGKITAVFTERVKPATYNIAFHGGRMALWVPHDIIREARTLEQLALCADGC